MVRLGVLASRESWYTRDLARAAIKARLISEFRLLSFSEFQIGLAVGCNGTSSLALHCGPLRVGDHATRSRIQPDHIDCLRELDAVIVRTMPLGSLESVIFRMDCLQALAAAGMAVVNSPRSLEVAIDKWLTLHRLHLAGVATPPTIACQSRDAALAAFELMGGDVLVKPIFGGEGRGIVRVQDKDTAWRVFGTIQQIGQVLYVQQFLDHLGYDIRVLVIGDKRFSIKRFGPKGDWRTNITLGGRAEPHEITATELEMANRCVDAVGGSVLGIDLLPLRDGRLVAIEVNAVPGWKGLSEALNVDIASEVIEHTIQMSRTNFSNAVMP
jgi:RimK family alpha-L-glutamate ligase